MTIPSTSISLGFHSQIEPYRSFLTTDMPSAFESFSITRVVYEAFVRDNKFAGSKTIGSELPTAEAMLQKGLEIQAASQALRDAGGNHPVPPLRTLIDEFLKMSAAWMVAEVALGVTAPDQPIATEPGEFIRRLYLLVYSSEFRKKPDRGEFDEVAWNALQQAVAHGSGSFDDLLPYCRILCAQVADEFIARQWAEVW